jgi:type IV pilus assembly protein PilN
MVRINLLPTRDAPRRQAAVVQLVVLGILAVVAIAAIIAVDTWQQGMITAQSRTNQIIDARIVRIERQIQDHDQIRQRIGEIESKQGVIDQLQAGRTGPVLVMVELSKVLSRNGSPTIDHDRYMELVRRSPGQAFDPNWDGRRLWLRDFREENRQVELSGFAMSHEDVAELLRRLSLSDYFHEVVLVETRSDSAASQQAGPFAPQLVNFQVRCSLRYEGRPAAGQEAPAADEATPASQAAATGA